MQAALAIFMLALIAVGLTILPSIALQSLGILIATMVTGCAGGAAVGFLFGIPRVLSGAGTSSAVVAAPVTVPASASGGDDAPGGAVPQQTGHQLLASNSNLEQASDWLTKIILGVGLTQFYEINNALFRFEALIQSHVASDNQLTPVVAAIIMVFSVIGGFMTMYLETRLVLSRIFNSVEQDLQLQLQLQLRQAIRDRDFAKEEQALAQSRADDLETSVKTIADAPSNSATTLAPAAESLKSAASSDKASPELKSIAAQALAASGRPDEASDLIPQGKGASAKDRISAMQVALYKPAPDGFGETLKIAGELSGSPEAKGNADYWFYQAAAFGQQHHFVLTTAADDDQRAAALTSARNNALDCARRCVQIDSDYELRIFWLMEPAVSPTPTDDDLVDFVDDAEFLALVHPPAGNAG